ncbi:MAG: HAD-IA family hydrolase [Chloroflexi bacterium]|nr:HAD-IA family hydrolase [Chloroflexota bacterium]MCL5110217.1 HAD-IA family hydrolase [Chloroflexota bacterium]
MMIKAVFLDFYNTICYFVPSRDERQAQACREFGHAVKPEAFWRAYVVGEDYWTEANARYAIAKRSPAESEAFYAAYEQVLLRAAGLEVNREQALEIYRRYSRMERSLSIFDDVGPTLRELRGRGLVVGLISNTDRDAGPMCAELGVAEHFDFVLSSCLVGFEKPDPRIFQLALEKAGVAPHEAIHVGDQYKSDVAGALAAGIQPLLLDRYGMLGHLDGCPHIASLREITRYLR